MRACLHSLVYVLTITALALPGTAALAQPTLNKSFSPTAIDPGQTTVLTFVVTNPGAAVNNVGFVDTLPAGLQVALPVVGGTCPNAAAATLITSGSGLVTVSALQVPAATFCTVTVSVTNTPGMLNGSCSALPAAFTNAAGNVTVTNVGNAITPSCVTVGGPPVVTIPTLSSASLLALAGLLAVGGLLALRR